MKKQTRDLASKAFTAIIAMHRGEGVDMSEGGGRAYIWTCDLTGDSGGEGERQRSRQA